MIGVVSWRVAFGGGLYGQMMKIDKKGENKVKGVSNFWKATKLEAERKLERILNYF